jgi:hypothetical protein
MSMKPNRGLNKRRCLGNSTSLRKKNSDKKNKWDFVEHNCGAIQKVITKTRRKRVTQMGLLSTKRFCISHSSKSTALLKWGRMIGSEFWSDDAIPGLIRILHCFMSYASHPTETKVLMCLGIDRNSIRTTKQHPPESKLLRVGDVISDTIVLDC